MSRLNLDVVGRTDDDPRNPARLQGLTDATVLIRQPADGGLAAAERFPDGSLHPMGACTKIRQSRMIERKPTVDLVAPVEQPPNFLPGSEQEVMTWIGRPKRADRGSGHQDVPQ